MFKVRSLALAVLVSSVANWSTAGLAQSLGDPRSGPAIGFGISTIGITGELSMKAMSQLVVRANGNWASVDYKPSLTDIDVDGSMRIAGAGLIGDWHPFENGFRFSGGVRWHQARFSGDASGQDVKLNGVTYTTAQYGKLHGEIEPGSNIAPYFGLGWDSSHFSESRFNIGFEIGAMYLGQPKATLTASKAGSTPGLQANADAEAKKLRDDYGKFGEFWPVIGLNAKYRF